MHGWFCSLSLLIKPQFSVHLVYRTFGLVNVFSRTNWVFCYINYLNLANIFWGKGKMYFFYNFLIKTSRILLIWCWMYGNSCLGNRPTKQGLWLITMNVDLSTFLLLTWLDLHCNTPKCTMKMKVLDFKQRWRTSI